MTVPYPPHIQQLSTTDPAFFELVAREHDLVMGPGAMDVKSKLLVLLAVDAYAGSTGVAPIAEAARRCGASQHEIVETLRIATHVAGGRVLTAAAPALLPG